MMPLIPARMAAVWILVLLLVGALHVWHARSARGAMTWWHAAHVSMVIGMILMLLSLPHDGSAAGALAIPTLHAVLAVCYVGQAAAMAVALGRVAGVDRQVWLAAMPDLLVMAYMLVPAAARPTAVTSLAVGYLCVTAVVWLAVPGGWLRMTASRSGPRSPASAAMAAPGTTPFHGPPLASPPAPSPTAFVGRPSASLLGPPRVLPIAPSPTAVGATAVIDGRPATSVARHRVSVRFAEHLPAAVRLTVAVIVVSMAWMLLAM